MVLMDPLGKYSLDPLNPLPEGLPNGSIGSCNHIGGSICSDPMVPMDPLDSVEQRIHWNPWIQWIHAASMDPLHPFPEGSPNVSIRTI